MDDMAFDLTDMGMVMGMEEDTLSSQRRSLPRSFGKLQRHAHLEIDDLQQIILLNQVSLSQIPIVSVSKFQKSSEYTVS